MRIAVASQDTDMRVSPSPQVCGNALDTGIERQPLIMNDKDDQDR